MPRPRVELYPPYVDSFGPEAIEFAARAGLFLDGWQQQSLTHMLGVKADGRWACFEFAELVARQNGKGAILEGRALAGLFLLGEQLIMWSAHEYKTSIRAFKRLKALIQNLGMQVDENLWDVDGILVKISNTNGEEGFERLDTHAELKFLARSKGSGRGFSGDLVIIDETFAYTDEQQEALLPTMSARSMEIPGPQIIYTSSPPLRGDSGEILFRLRKRAEKGGDDSLGYRDWGADGDLDNLDQVDLADRAAWARTNPALGVRISEDFVARELRTMGNEGFARERLGIWPLPLEDGAGALNFETWKALAEKESQAGDDLTFALDVSPARDWSSIAVFSPRPDGVGHVEVMDRRRGTDWVVARLAELKARWNPVAIAVDVKGPAGSLLLDLEKAGMSRPSEPEKPQRGDLIIPTANEVAAACGQLADAVTQKTVRHIDQAPLNSAVGGVSTRPLGDAYAWGRKNSSTDISPLVAVTLARWAHFARVDAIQAPPAPATAGPQTADTGDLWRPTSRLGI